MSRRVEIKLENGKYSWIDHSNPSEEELSQIATTYDIHPVHIKNFLEKNQLPKYERTEKYNFILVRFLDECAIQNSETIQNLTHKILIFVTESAIITIHRIDPDWMHPLRERWNTQGMSLTHRYLINTLLSRVIGSYSKLVDNFSSDLDILEKNIFFQKKHARLLEESYKFKRVVAIATRVLRLTEDCIPDLGSDVFEDTYLKDLEDRIRRVLFSLDDVTLRTDQILQLHLALDSHKNNEVMRVLTLFSAFFLPLTFIVGIYGMNFNHMPELQWPYGYPFILGAMAAVTLMIWIWFKKKEWM